MGGERYRVLFEQLGDLRFERGKGINRITVGVLMILRSCKDTKKLEALAKLCCSDEGFGDRAMHLEVMRSLLPLFEKAHEADEGVTEEEVLDDVFELGKACNAMQEFYRCDFCLERANEGFMCLQGGDHAKSVDATYQLVFQTGKDDEERITELRALWERVNVSLPDEAVTYEVADSLGIQLKETGYLKQVPRGEERVLGKTHPDALATIMNMATVYMEGSKVFTKAEELYRQALDGYEKSLEKDHKDTKKCARNLAILLVVALKDKEKTR